MAGWRWRPRLRVDPPGTAATDFDHSRYTLGMHSKGIPGPGLARINSKLFWFDLIDQGLGHRPIVIGINIAWVISMINVRII